MNEKNKSVGSRYPPFSETRVRSNAVLSGTILCEVGIAVQVFVI